MAATSETRPIPETVTAALATLGSLRPGTAGDAIDGLVPALVLSPATPGAVANALAEASAAGLPTVIRGGGTKRDWGHVPARVDLVVSLAALTRVVAHRHGDLIVIVEAGAKLVDVNAELARQGQWLPIDSPFADATIGGVLATNASGAVRHRYGTPRDLLIGIGLAMTDGRVIKAGGEVVKNVAGYDLGKLACGSHGTFGAIVSATFKLVPHPKCTTTVVARFERHEIARAIAAVAASQCEPLACDVRAEASRSTVELVVRFGSTAGAVDAQVRGIMAAWAEPAAAEVMDGDAEASLWSDAEREIWSGDAAVLRLGWLPASLPVLLDAMSAASSDAGVDVRLVGRAGVGAGLMRITGATASQAEAIRRVRSAAPAVQHVAVLKAGRELKAAVDVWPTAGSGAVALRALKTAFDPAGILNAGRGPI